MKKFLALPLIALLLVACQSNDVKEVAMESLDTAAFPIKIKNYPHWEMNPDQKNVTLAMNLVKGFAALDTNAIKPLISDSIHLTIDGYEFKGTNSEFLKAAQGEMNKFKSIKINLHDVESVISKDKKSEYVSMWYVQYNEFKDGKKDSIKFFNDIKIKNGKVIEWSEYAQNFIKK